MWGVLSNIRRALTDPGWPPWEPDAFIRRLLRVVLAVFLAGLALGFAAIILIFAWAAARDPAMLSAVRWLIRADWACLAVVGACAALFWWHRVRDPN